MYTVPKWNELLCFILLSTSAAYAQKTIALRSVPLDSIHDAAWDATRSRVWIAAGSSVYGFDADGARIESSFATGAVDRIAVSDDGKYLYAGSRTWNSLLRRYQLETGAQDLELFAGQVAAVAVIPGQPESFIVAKAYTSGVALYDRAIQRGSALPISIAELHVRRSDGAIFGLGTGAVYQFEAGSQGLTIRRTMPVASSFSFESRPVWTDQFLVDRNGAVFDLNAGTTLGRVATNGGCTMAAGGAVYTAEPEADNRLVRYSLETFRAESAVRVTGTPSAYSACTQRAVGLALPGQIALLGAGVTLVQMGSDWDAISLSGPPEPQTDASGIVHLRIAAKGIAYDTVRGILWASVAGTGGELGNTVASIDPATGRVTGSVIAASEPGAISIASDAGRMFVISEGSPIIASIDLEKRERTSTFTVHDDGNFEPESIAAVPDKPETVLVIRKPAGVAYASSIAVYDSGVRRQKTAGNHVLGSGIGSPEQPYYTDLFPGDSPRTFYALGSELTSAGGHAVGRLHVDDDGVRLDARLQPLELGETGYYGMRASRIVFDGDSVFTAGGEWRSADLTVLHGSFAIQQSYATSGAPVAFTDRNQVAYLHKAGLKHSAALTLFDLSALRPLATIPMPMTVRAAVRAGAATVAVLAGDEILLVRLSMLTPWPSYSMSPQGTGTTGLRRLDVPLNAIAGTPDGSKLLLALTSTAGELGNRLVLYDAAAGRIEKSVYAGSEPEMLVSLREGKSAYSFLRGENRIARVDLESGARDLVFATDPEGGQKQYPAYHMAAAPDGALAVSYYGGGIAVFDNGVPRPVVDANREGTGAFLPSTYYLEFDGSGSILYALETHWSSSGFKRCAVSADGVRWLSSMDGLIGGTPSYSGGLLYTTSGSIVDAERSRRVGQFPASSDVIVPDAAAGRLYGVSGSVVQVFDIATRSLIGSTYLPTTYAVTPRSIVRFGSDGLAILTGDVFTGQTSLYLLNISSIRMLTSAMTTAQPALPRTPGVTVVDLAAEDLAYDVARDLLYVTTPNREARNGDKITAIDPSTGKVTGSWPAGRNPRLLAISEDSSQLFFSGGAVANEVLSGYSVASEMIRTWYPVSGEFGQVFPARPAGSDFSYAFSSLSPITGSPASVAVIEELHESSGAWYITFGANSLRVYDNGVAREVSPEMNTFFCSQMVQGSVASRLYCSGSGLMYRLDVDASGVRVLDSFRLLPGPGSFGPMVFHDGRIYTSTGLVIEPESKWTVKRVDAFGPVAVMGGRVYWLDPGYPTPLNGKVILRSFDVVTLQPQATREINVSAPATGRLIPCGGDRLAFQAGNEIYIVHP